MPALAEYGVHQPHSNQFATPADQSDGIFFCLESDNTEPMAGSKLAWCLTQDAE